MKLIDKAKEQRYPFYIVSLNMLSNIVVFVPHLLINDRFNGTLMSLIFAIVIGTALMYSFTRAIAKFPQQTLPDILSRCLPKWFCAVFLSFLTFMWFLAGALTLITFSDMTHRFITPETSETSILVLFIFASVYVSRMSSDKVLYGIEALLVINVPLILYILNKALFEKTVSWPIVFDMGTYLLKAPTFNALSGATYLFSGYANFAIFNRVFVGRLKTQFVWVIPFLGATALLTSYLIPIGILGSDAVDHYVYPWVATSDTLRMEFFFVERVLFPFLLLYLLISLISAIVHWHVGYEVLSNQFSFTSKIPQWITFGAFAVGTVVLRMFMKEEQEIFNFATLWLKVRFVSEFALVAVMLYAARRLKSDAL